MRRRLDGILVLDKPAGITSNAALQQVKRLLDAAKAGHAGTLDPLASGVLPVLFGEATKLSSFLLDADKEYVADLRLGVRTTTGDAEGEVIERRAVDVDDSKVASVIARFRGEIEQVPPMHSALKHGGRPLYEIARQGLTVPRSPRRIVIHELEVLELASEVLRIRVLCSKGTYVRVLAEDLGAALGCGAHLCALRRTVAGCFRIGQAVTLDELNGMDTAARERRLLQVDALLQELPALHLDERMAGAFRNGRTVGRQGGPQGRRRVYAGASELLGVGEVGPEGDLRPLRVLARGAGGAQAAEIPRKTL